MFMARPAGDEAEEEDERIYALKPMNCPGHVQIFKHGLRSYRELPVRLRRIRRRATATSRPARCTA